MYAPRIIERRLAEAEKEFGFIAEEHTIAQVIDFETYLRQNGKYIYDANGNPSGVQNLSEFDAHWIQNEIIRCTCDAAYWLTRYCFLIPEDGNIVRFEFRIPQRILFEIIADLEERGASIQIMVLKARQLGITSLIQPLIGHRIFFGYGVNAVAGSADTEKTGIMASKMLLAYDMMPVWLRPKATSRVAGDHGHLTFGGSLSGVSFQHGAQVSGIARGTTPTIYHLSEVATFTDAENQIESSLFRCVHSSPRVFGVLESSGEGDKGWWPNIWRNSKLNWPNTRLFPLFLPWFCGIGLYPNDTFINVEHPIPQDWVPKKSTTEHAAKCNLYVRYHPLLRKHLGENWTLPREQQWWWELQRQDAENNGTLSKFFQELASDDEEALQRSSESVFGHAVIEQVESNRKPTYEVYGLSGQSIEDDHEPPPSDIDYTQERIIVRYQARNKPAYRWELIPLRFGRSLPPLDERDRNSADGKLIVFHHPQPGVDYSIGVDTSQGKGLDSTVISVWALGYNGQPDVQVAEFASPYVNHVEAFSFILCIAAFYKKYMAVGISKWPEPYVSIEQVQSVGDIAQLQMDKMGYSKFHIMPRYDNSSKRIAKQKRTQMKRGWFTFSYTRDILVGNWVHAVQNGWARINSPWLIDELKHFEVVVTKSGKEKLQHEAEEHDDRIFSGAMAVFCPHDTDVLALRSKKRLAEVSTLPPVDLGEYNSYVSTRSIAAGAHVWHRSDVQEIFFSDRELDRFAR